MMARAVQPSVVSVTRMVSTAASSTLKIVPDAQHNKGFWSGEFREAVLWMFRAETLATAAK